jgi:hypothetical protein
MKKQPTSAAAEDKLDFATLSELRGDGEGPLDHPCPLCGPDRKSEYNQARPVLRTWEPAPGFITFYCSRLRSQRFGASQCNTAAAATTQNTTVPAGA